MGFPPVSQRLFGFVNQDVFLPLRLREKRRGNEEWGGGDKKGALNYTPAPLPFSPQPLVLLRCLGTVYVQ